MTRSEPNDVELSITVWERTWRTTLTAEFFERIQSDATHQFARITVTVNNVDDRTAVHERLHQLIADGNVDSFIDVDHELPAALARTGLSLKRLQPLEHYTDHFLVKICQPGPRFLVHWDTDVRLTSPGDWITPGVHYLMSHSQVVVVTTGWPDSWSMDMERLDADGDFDLGYGFSDQLFLIDRRRFAQPIYRSFAPASWWYPTSHIGPIFEQRVDAWMRRNRLQRATYRAVRYEHAASMVNHPARTTTQRIRRRLYAELGSLLRVIPGFVPALHRRPRRPSTLRQGS